MDKTSPILVQGPTNASSSKDYNHCYPKMAKGMPFFAFIFSIFIYLTICYHFNLSPSKLIHNNKFWFSISNTLIIIIALDYFAFSSYKNNKQDIREEHYNYYTMRRQKSMPLFRPQKSLNEIMNTCIPEEEEEEEEEEDCEDFYRKSARQKMKTLQRQRSLVLPGRSNNYRNSSNLNSHKHKPSLRNVHIDQSKEKGSSQYGNDQDNHFKDDIRPSLQRIKILQRQRSSILPERNPSSFNSPEHRQWPNSVRTRRACTNVDQRDGNDQAVNKISGQKKFQRSKSDIPKRVVIDESKNIIRRVETELHEPVDSDVEDHERKTNNYSNMSNDELNKRVEDFIQRFNNQIRLQRSSGFI